MRLKNLMLAGLIALVMIPAGGCAAIDKIRDFGTAVTAPIDNPIGRRELVVLEGTYGLAVAGAVAYRRDCLRRTVQAACQATVNKLQVAAIKARRALDTATEFARNNPTISVASVVAAARKAVTDFKTETEVIAVAK